MHLDRALDIQNTAAGRTHPPRTQPRGFFPRSLSYKPGIWNKQESHLSFAAVFRKPLLNGSWSVTMTMFIDLLSLSRRKIIFAEP